MRPPRTVFVDRDGVINVNRSDHVTSWGQFEFLPGALAGLAMLADHEIETIIVTNQSIVNRGLVSQAEVDRIHDQMLAVIADHGGQVRAILCCPHRPDQGCACRKPRPGLLLEAEAKLGVDLHDAVLVGDHPIDLEAARRAGCSSILVLSGRTADWTSSQLPPGCLAVLPDLLAAARQLSANSFAPQALLANGLWRGTAVNPSLAQTRCLREYGT
jgi:D-glycero-D-manno-heptose 1,7-bisphosphate phosphatase